MGGKKYESEKRKEPRILKPLNLPPIGEVKTKREPIEPSRGILTYQRFDGDLDRIFETSISSNNETIKREFQNDIKLVRKSLDLQYRIACEFFWIIDYWAYTTISPVQKVLGPCFRNNLIALKSSELATREGLYSFARPTLRMIFESLIIAKFCTANHETEVYDKWIDGKNVYLSNGVMKKILEPDSSVFSDFWGFVSEYTHSSVYAMQPDTCIENVKNEISLNYLLIHMLSECNFHILNSHIVNNSLKHHQKTYRSVEDYTKPREELKNLYSNLRKTYGRKAKEFVRSYKSAWEVKGA